jgi:nitrogen fixation NifU-like protein
MDQLYREQILDHYKNPRNKGHISNATISREEWNPICGDRVQLDILFNQKNIVQEVAFVGEGCAISQAAASMLTEKIKGMTKGALQALQSDDIISMLGIQITPGRMQCATLALKAVQKSL